MVAGGRRGAGSRWPLREMLGWRAERRLAWQGSSKGKKDPPKIGAACFIPLSVPFLLLGLVLRCPCGGAEAPFALCQCLRSDKDVRKGAPDPLTCHDFFWLAFVWPRRVVNARLFSLAAAGHFGGLKTA